MKTQTKKTAAKTSTKPALTNKIVIRDACATAFCEKEPVKGSSYCAEHKAPAAAAEKRLDAMDKANAKRAAKVLKDPSVRKQLAAMIATAPKAGIMSTTCGARGCLNVPVEQTPKGPRCAEHMPKAKDVPNDADAKRLAKMHGSPAKPAPKAAAAPAPADMDARPTIAQLLAKGWTQGTIAAALSTSPGRVWFWNSGKNCRRLADLRSLVFQTVPRKDLVVGPVKTGSLKVPRPAAAASPRGLKLTHRNDPRQLLLDLANAIQSALR